MSAAHPPSSTLSRPHRLLAWLLIGVVFALAALAASPDLHQRLHAWTGTEATAQDHHHHTAPAVYDETGCAIVLFAQGLTVPLDLPQVAAPDLAWSEWVASAREELLLSPPRYLRQPERGPPARG